MTSSALSGTSRASALPAVPTGVVEWVLARRWVLIVGVWAAPALLAASETYLFWRLGGRSFPFWRAIVMEGPAWMVYALLTPTIFAFGRRLPLRRTRLAPHLAAHLAISLTIGLLY